jgi:hypothetical protein
MGEAPFNDIVEASGLSRFNAIDASGLVLYGAARKTTGKEQE